MSRLDDIKPSSSDGTYKTEFLVEGEWVVLAMLTKEQIIKVAEKIDEVMEDE